jgi:hypothetical protein
MSKADQFWQYAKEATLSASCAKTDDERKSLLDLARIWTQAALLERQHTLVHYVNPKNAKVLVRHNDLVAIGDRADMAPTS